MLFEYFEFGKVYGGELGRVEEKNIMKSIYFLGFCCLFGNVYVGLNVIVDLGGEFVVFYFDGINNQFNEFELLNLLEVVVLFVVFVLLVLVLLIFMFELMFGSVEVCCFGLSGMQLIFLLGNDLLFCCWLDE